MDCLSDEGEVLVLYTTSKARKKRNEEVLESFGSTFMVNVDII